MEFQSPHGDSLFSDLTSKIIQRKSNTGFNPLTGIRCFLTCGVIDKFWNSFDVCFNPLTGIRCFLTGS